MTFEARVTRFIGGEVAIADRGASQDVVVAGTRLVDADTEPATGERVIDASGLRIAPGFIDTQINGGLGFDLARNPESIWDLSVRLPACGVTAFLPTIVTSPVGTVDAALAVLARRPPGHEGATPLGLHVEGPMLNPIRVGAHPPHLLVPPRPDVIEGWTRPAGVAMVTLAPELPGGTETVRTLRSRDIVVAIGHSEATYEEVAAAVDAGATHVTHLYNAMSPLGHREPGVVGAALERDDLTAGIVVDGIHSHPAAVRVAWNAKGPGGLALVSDAVAAQGMPGGDHSLGATQVRRDESGVRTPEGVLAGSDLTLDVAVRNLVDFTGCRWEEAVGAASTVPARIIGEVTRGRIATGCAADLVLLAPDFTVALTMIAGRVVHDRDGRAV